MSQSCGPPRPGTIRALPFFNFKKRMCCMDVYKCKGTLAHSSAFFCSVFKTLKSKDNACAQMDFNDFFHTMYSTFHVWKTLSENM
jgi:hypothetical protein